MPVMRVEHMRKTALGICMLRTLVNILFIYLFILFLFHLKIKKKPWSINISCSRQGTCNAPDTTHSMLFIISGRFFWFNVLIKRAWHLCCIKNKLTLVYVILLCMSITISWKLYLHLCGNAAWCGTTLVLNSLIVKMC